MLRRFNRILSAPGYVLILAAALTVGAILQGIAFVLLIPFLRAFLSGGDYAGPLTAIITLGILAFIISTWEMVASYKISVDRVCDDVIDQLGRRVPTLPLGWFDSSSSGRVASTISEEVSILSHLVSIIMPGLINSIVTPVTILIATFILDWRLAALMALSLPLLALIWRLVYTGLSREQALAPPAAAASASRILEFAQLQPVLRARGLATSASPVLGGALTDEHRLVMSLLRRQGPPMALYNLVVQSVVGAVLAAGLWLVTSGGLDIIDYIAIAAMATRFAGPLALSFGYLSEGHRQVVALDAIEEILLLDPLPEPPHPRTPAGSSIALDNVSFGYNSSTPLFKDLSLSVDAGEVVALVGPSGCGKSTILRLIARFWDVDDGQVMIGGQDVRKIGTAGLMESIAMVFQEVYLFDTTIFDNVKISRPDASDEEVAAAMSKAGLDAVLARLPHGAQTRVGEGGARLSGGERQRVSIARAFLKDAPILLLDEITSALDAENESAITGVITELARGRTVLVIAHRLTTIERADRIIVLSGRERGEITQIVEEGSPAELAAAGGLYASLVADSLAVSRWHLIENTHER
ncbi:MAG: ABC transporter ATP-binding protein [Flaviflexus sp.]|nr:ABC transporter ATP-binding protein [Flaviflexus sp.]